jgi:hypothetical protein
VVTAPGWHRPPRVRHFSGLTGFRVGVFNRNGVDKALQVHLIFANSMKHKSLLLFASFVCTLMAMSTGAAPEEPLQNPALKRFYSELRNVFRKHYPQATSHLLKESIHFEHDTRLFIVHEPLKTGEWQDPWETRGPEPGGILCEINLVKGKYQGAAVVPQTFDKRYFTVLLMAPYASKHDVHLYIHLSYPPRVNGEFLKEFTDLANNFEKYLD